MTFQHFPHTNAWGRKFDLAVKKSFNWLCCGLTTCQPLWVILCSLPEKGRKEIEEIVEEMKKRDREEKEKGTTVKKQNKNIPPLPYLLLGQQALPNCKTISVGCPSDVRYTTPSHHPTIPSKTVKGQPRLIIWTNLVDLESMMLYTVQLRWFFKIPPEPVGSGFGWKGLNFSIPLWFHPGRWICCVPVVKSPDKITFEQVKFDAIMTGNWNSRGGHAVFQRWSEKAVSKGAWLKPVVLFRHARLNRTKLPTWSNQSFQLIVWQQLTNFDCKHSHSLWAYRIVGIYIHKTYCKFGA